MRITSNNGQSIVAQLTNIINNALPRIANTDIYSHLGNVKADPKGKAIVFTWKKSIYGFRMTENLKVYEKDFTNTFVITEECKNIEKMVEASFNSVVAEKEPIKEETKKDSVVVTPLPAIEWAM